MSSQDPWLWASASTRSRRRAAIRGLEEGCPWEGSHLCLLSSLLSWPQIFYPARRNTTWVLDIPYYFLRPPHIKIVAMLWTLTVRIQAGHSKDADSVSQHLHPQLGSPKHLGAGARWGWSLGWGDSKLGSTGAGNPKNPLHVGGLPAWEET